MREMLHTQPGISIIIPCLNEERTIASSVDHAHRVLNLSRRPGEVLVVDNGSHDRSVQLATLSGARVIVTTESGYGSALRAGFANARFEFLGMVDADLSYPMEEFNRLFKQLEEGAEFVLGNRLRGKIAPRAMPFLNRYLGTPVLSFCLRIKHSIPTYDCNSGMRAFRRSHFLQMNLRCTGMEIASEMLIRAAQLRLRYREVVIPFYPDQRDRAPHLNRWRDGWRHLCLIVKGV